jgi:membrane peptidoglycan carboxypeptidase
MRNVLSQPQAPRRPAPDVRPGPDRAAPDAVERPVRWLRGLALGSAALVVAAFALVAGRELSRSDLQSRWIAPFARAASFEVGPGATPDLWFPSGGPYDERLGYTRLPGILPRLAARGYAIEAQARPTPQLRRVVGWGLFPPYREKTRAGLEIRGRGGDPIFAAAFPERSYRRFESIPRVIVDSILFIENRELLDSAYPRRNPAIEWDRFAGALLGKALRAVGAGGDGAGGSTLATQLEKFRHSRHGVTGRPLEKVRQIASASLRAYQGGPDTTAARRQLVADYLDSAPFAAVPPYGEVIGLADGLWAWYGADVDEVNRLLDAGYVPSSKADAEARAVAYRQVLSLLLSVRAPSYYLVADHAALAQRTDSYLPLLAEAGVIPPELRDQALALRLDPRMRASARSPVDARARKQANAVRARLLPLLGLGDLYALDRMDLEVQSTLDERAQADVAQTLVALRDPARAEAAGLKAFRLLDRGDPGRVTYSFSLYERTPGANLLRVQADNLDQPFDVNDGVKLDLGSTAKLRTLATYLEVIAALHRSYAGKSRAELDAVAVDPTDHLTRFALDQLRARPTLPLSDLLERALDRTYSASPHEAFFTGGGLHRFANFDPEDDARRLSVRQAFRRSVNLVFVRLMRDVVRYYVFRAPGSTGAILRDRKDPRRETYLRRFADREGQLFVGQFWRKYRGKTPDQALDTLLRSVHPTPRRFAAALRAAAPEVEFAAFDQMLHERLPESILSTPTVERLYDRHAAGRYDLVDRAYLAGVHPLELWLVGWLREHPAGTRDEALEASADERIDVYRWLFRTRYGNAQDSRIRTLLEIEAFLEIHRQWKRLGYPFDSLVPSYATAIGSAADRPSSLAELAGIILNDGVRQPSIRVEKLHFARETPYETIVAPRLARGERVMRREVAAVLRGAMIDVVENGTAVRARGALVDADGRPVRVGGKTGTGDHRYKVFGPGGQLLESRVVNRTATFVFFAGDRFYGVVTAYVAGSDAAHYGFTSSLPAQLFRVVAPSLRPLLDPGLTVATGEPAQALLDAELAAIAGE